LFGLKSQMALSSIKTAIARYKTVREQLFRNPFWSEDEEGSWHRITKTLEWLWKPIIFNRPQAVTWSAIGITVLLMSDRFYPSTPLAKE